MVLIPVLAVGFMYLITFQYGKSVTKALADSWIGLVFFVWLVTEILSVFEIWTSTAMFFAWSFLLLVLIYIAYKRGYISSLKKQYIKAIFNRGCIKYRKWFICFGVYFVFIFIAAILSSQYNMDSMVYHLPRIMRWIQNHSVGHFAPGIEFQVRYPCLTEYLVAQIYLFCSNDRLANLVQTIAYLESSIIVFGISRKIGASVKASFTASFIYLMIPMALVQAFSTQTDDVAGLFLLIFIFFLLDFIQVEKLKMDKTGFMSAIKLALSVMLGYLCKPTICFVMLVFFIWMCIVRIIKRDSLKILLKYVIVGVIVAGILYTPLYMKSYQTYILVNKELTEKAAEKGQEVVGLSSAGRALAPDSFNVRKALRDPALFAITCIQNLGRNSTSICLPEYNRKWEKLVAKAGGWLNKDVSAYRTQEGVFFFYQDTASNPWIMILTLFACLCLFIRIGRTNRLQTIYIMCSVAGFLIQCGLMGYTQYRTRYLVGAMAVLCPSIAITIDTLKINKNYKDIIMALCIFGASIGGLNTLSFEVPRIKKSYESEEIHQYMLGNEEDEYVYGELIRIINENGYKKIGLDGGIYMEYPLWGGIKNLERLENVNVASIYFSQYEDMAFKPECIVKVIGDENEIKEGDTLECHGITYQCIWSVHWYQSYFSIYVEEE